MNRDLSIRQSQVLDYIKEQIKLKGYPPSLREICNALGVKSTSTIYSHLNTLEKKGYLKKDPTKPRAITILNPPIWDDLDFMHYAKNREDLSLMPSIKGDDLNVFFNSFLIDNPNISVYKNHGDSMKNAGIFHNDYVVVDTSKHEIDNQIVLAIVNDEYSTIKRFIRDRDMVKLTCENDSDEFIFVNSRNVKVIGVVTGSFRNFS